MRRESKLYACLVLFTALYKYLALELYSCQDYAVQFLSTAVSYGGFAEVLCSYTLLFGDRLQNLQ